MTDEFRTIVVGENEGLIECTVFGDGMLMLKDSENATILISEDQLSELISKLKEGE